MGRRSDGIAALFVGGGCAVLSARVRDQLTQQAAYQQKNANSRVICGDRHNRSPLTTLANMMASPVKR